MSDSQTSIFYMPEPSKKHGTVNLPAKYGIIFNNKEVFNLTTMSDHIYGLTPAKNKIKAKMNRICKIYAYELSVNYPATLLSNNVLMSNTVYQAALAHKYMAQINLAESEDVHPDYVKTISLKHCEFQEITLTFCLEYESAKQAFRLLLNLKRYAGVVLKSPRNQSEKISKKVGVAASGDTQSWYINKVDGRSVRFYVKDRNQPNKFASFVSPEVENAIYEIGKRVLRVEITLSAKYLAENGLSKPSAWRGAKGKAVYREQFDWLRTLLKVDADYRVNKPQQRHVDGLPERDQLVLAWYLKGKPINQLPQFQSGEWKKSPIKQRILERLRIDIDIPWKTQCRIAIPGLSELLSLDRLVKPPKELLEHCHFPSTVKRKNRELRKLAEAAIAAAQLKWEKKGGGEGQATSKGKSKAQRGAAGAVASFPVSALGAALEGLRKAGVLLPSPTDGTTSDISNLMG
ncbi:hypothetical protein [Diaphorobacter sp.]|uniref:hypothetical protein n=1 Tax=Diaphorobacter sp. TaxID=1934310 RepID=UPI003D1089CE